MFEGDGLFLDAGLDEALVDKFLDLGLKTSDLESALALDLGSLCLSSGIGHSVTLVHDGIAVGLQLEQLLVETFRLAHVIDQLLGQFALGLLFQLLGQMACLGLLSLGGDLDGHGDCLLQVSLGLFVDGLDVLDVDVGDHEVVLL